MLFLPFSLWVLARKPEFFECEINYRPTCGMRDVWACKDQGLVNVELVRTWVQNEHNRILRPEYWSEYRVTPTDVGKKMINEYNLQYQGEE